MPCSFIRSSASSSLALGPMVSGFTTMPDSKRFTRRTCSACTSGSRLRWITPMPPNCAMAIAMLASVTVSIAEATIGTLSGMSRVIRLRMSTSDGSTSDRPGLSSTSSKVSASSRPPFGYLFLAIANSPRPPGYKWASLRGSQSRGGESAPMRSWRRRVARRMRDEQPSGANSEARFSSFEPSRRRPRPIWTTGPGGPA